MTERPLEVGMLLYPGLTMLDLVGPQTVFAFHGNTHLLWKTLDPVTSDSGVAMVPTTSLADCPNPLDILFVPGGAGTGAMMRDAEILAFLREAAVTATAVTSVCSGSLILGAAGLLDGYEATSHWAVVDRLADFGATPVRARVVTDRNRSTGGGVTAGIDFGLTLLAQLRGERAAMTTQLLMEYDPMPPFDSGTPAKAEPDIVQAALGAIQEMERADNGSLTAVDAPA